MNSQAVAEARQLVQSGMSANKAAQQVGDKYGVARSTIQGWATKQGTPLGTVASQTAANARACARAERLAHIEVGLAKVAEAFAHLAEQLTVVGDGKQAQGFAAAAKACYDMHRMSEGEATSRVEYSDRDGFAAEVARLAAEMDALPA